MYINAFGRMIDPTQYGYGAPIDWGLPRLTIPPPAGPQPQPSAGTTGANTGMADISTGNDNKGEPGQSRGIGHDGMPGNPNGPARSDIASLAAGLSPTAALGAAAMGIGKAIDIGNMLDEYSSFDDGKIGFSSDISNRALADIAMNARSDYANAAHEKANERSDMRESKDRGGPSPDNDGEGTDNGGQEGAWAKGGSVAKEQLTGPDPAGPDDGYGALKGGEHVFTVREVKSFGGHANIEGLRKAIRSRGRAMLRDLKRLGYL